MGNCQAVDTASLVIQHPSGGKSVKLFCPIPASQIMKTNPGHCVALLIATTTTTTTVLDDGADNDKTSVRITRVKLLKPTDTLTLGHVYRLISTQEVMKGLVAKKRRSSAASASAPPEKSNKMSEHDKQRQKSKSSTALKSKAWQPSLKSISESHS